MIKKCKVCTTYENLIYNSLKITFISLKTINQNVMNNIIITTVIKK